MLSRQDMHLGLCLVCPVSFSFFHLSFLSLVPLCRLGLHSSVRWRSAWLSCTCGPPRAHSKSKVALITVFNLPLSLNNSLPVVFLFFLSLRLALALSVITHFVFTPSPQLTYIYFNNLTLSQHQFSLCLFSLSPCSLQIL